MITLSETIKQECISVLEDYTGIILTVDQFDALMCKNTNLIPGIIEFGANDTMERENLTDALAIELTGYRWPNYGDTSEYKNQFYKNLDTGAIRLGYERIKK